MNGYTVRWRFRPQPPFPPDVEPDESPCGVPGPPGRCRTWQDGWHRCCVVARPGGSHGTEVYPHGCLCRREWVTS